MSKDKQKESLLRKTFLDISKGYSESYIEDKKVFIKHLSLIDQAFLDDKYQIKLKRLKSAGIAGEEDILKQLSAEGEWTKDDEDNLIREEDFILNLEKSKKALIIPSQIDQVADRIERAKEKLQKSKNKKQGLLGESAEAFAERYLSDISIYHTFFKDKELSEPFFTEDEFDELERKEIYQLISIYNKSSEALALDLVKELSLSGLFVNYFNVNEGQSNELFQRPTLELSFYQLNLITYCKIFKSIFKNIPDIPDEMREDPDKLLEFAESGHKVKEKIDKMRADAAKSKHGKAQSIVGATKKDMEKMGINPMESQSPMDFLKRKGKTSFSLLDGDFNV